MKLGISLTKVLEQQVQESDTSMFEVGEQRERNYRYYTLQPMGNEMRGRSHYVSPDVLDHTESMKSLFRETFLSNRKVVDFSSNGIVSQDEAAAKSAYANLMLDKNKKERLFSDFWHDAFLAKRGVVLIDWKQDITPVKVQIQGATQEQIMEIASQTPDVVGIDDSQLQMEQVMGPNGPAVLLSGVLVLQTDDSYACMQLCKPEDVYRDPKVADVADAMWATYEQELPRGTLVEDGYDPEQVEKLASNYRFRTDEVDFARKAHDQSHTRGRQVDRIKTQETVTVYRTWTWINLTEHASEFEEDFPDEVRLYEIHWCNGEVLTWADGTPAIKEADEIPFFEWTEYRISHSEYGLAGADIVAHTQKTQSALKRGILDNMHLRNTTRYEAVEQRIANPRDLLDNTPGGVVWSDEIGSVAPLATPELSPMTMSAVQMLQMDNERRGGLSSLAKGMNMDAISNQNADSMIERLTNAGKTRPMGAARDWAHTWLIPVCQYICRLGMRNDTRQRQVEQGGKQIMIAPQTWTDDDLSMSVAVALTPDEGTDHAQKLLMLHQIMSQDQDLVMLYGVKQKHALMDTVMDSLGISDSTPFMMTPESPEFAQMMQQRQQQAEAEQQQAAEAAQMQMQFMDNEQARKWQELNSKVMDTVADNQRADEELDWKKFVESKELEIEETQKRQVGIG